MSAQLSHVDLEGDWSPLLTRLPGWHRVSSNAWHGQGARLRDGQPPGAMRIDIDIQGGRRVKRITVADRKMDVADVAREIGERGYSSEFNLNHVAVNLSLGNTALVDCLKSGNADIFLERERRYDPTVGSQVEAEHLVSGKILYVTARFLPTILSGLEIAHIGWEVEDRDSVQLATSLLRTIDWPIIFGPDIVDGSFLVHFRGPDGRVHDVFHVLAR